MSQNTPCPIECFPDLDLSGMHLVQDHDTPLEHEDYSCEFDDSHKAFVRYFPDMMLYGQTDGQTNIVIPIYSSQSSWGGGGINIVV